MTILDVLFIARNGIHPPHDIENALRVPTGETKVVWQPYYLTFPNPENIVLSSVRYAEEFIDIIVLEDATDPETGDSIQVEKTISVRDKHEIIFTRADNGAEIVRDLTIDHEILGRVDKSPVRNEDGDSVNWKFRLKRPIEKDKVKGGYNVLPGTSIGQWSLWHVTADGAALKRLHEWMTTDENNRHVQLASGALAVQDIDQSQTFEPHGVADRLDMSGPDQIAKRAAIAAYCESQVPGSGAMVLDAETEPQIALAWVQAAQPSLSIEQINDEFWKVW